MELVSEGDFRKGLKPGVDHTVITSKPISTGTVLGMYRCRMVTKTEETTIKSNPPANFEGSKTSIWLQGVGK